MAKPDMFWLWPSVSYSLRAISVEQAKLGQRGCCFLLTNILQRYGIEANPRSAGEYLAVRT
ncbi:hypothetical protein AKJ16_DCAP09916 [Drosera capensis]